MAAKAKPPPLWDGGLSVYVRIGLVAVFGGRDGGHGRAGCGLVLIFAARTADRAAQELRLLVRFRWQAISGRTLAAARRQTAFGTFGARLAGPHLGGGGGWTLEALGPVAVHAIFVAIRTVGTVEALLTVGTLEAVLTIWPILTVGAVVPILTIAEATAVTLERTIAVARTLMLVAVFAVHALRAIFEAALAAFLEARLIVGALHK